MGKRAAAMAPSRTMTIEITHARTGRSMKKRASTAGLLSGFFGFAGVGHKGDRHVHELRLDRDARPHLLQAFDNHALAQVQALRDLPQAVVERPQLDGAGAYLVVLLDDVQDLLALAGIEDALAYHQRPAASAVGPTAACQQASPAARL